MAGRVERNGLTGVAMAWSVPPLKLNVEAVPVENNPFVRRVPPFRLTVAGPDWPVTPMMNFAFAATKPPLTFNVPALLLPERLTMSPTLIDAVPPEML